MVWTLKPPFPLSPALDLRDHLSFNILSAEYPAPPAPPVLLRKAVGGPVARGFNSGTLSVWTVTLRLSSPAAAEPVPCVARPAEGTLWPAETTAIPVALEPPISPSRLLGWASLAGPGQTASSVTPTLVCPRPPLQTGLSRRAGCDCGAQVSCLPCRPVPS